MFPIIARDGTAFPNLRCNVITRRVAENNIHPCSAIDFGRGSEVWPNVSRASPSLPLPSCHSRLDIQTMRENPVPNQQGRFAKRIFEKVKNYAGQKRSGRGLTLVTSELYPDQGLTLTAISFWAQSLAETEAITHALGVELGKKQSGEVTKVHIAVTNSSHSDPEDRVAPSRLNQSNISYHFFLPLFIRVVRPSHSRDMVYHLSLPLEMKAASKDLVHSYEMIDGRKMIIAGSYEALHGLWRLGRSRLRWICQAPLSLYCCSFLQE